MTSSTLMLDRLVPISLFNKGQASRIIERARTEGDMVVLKNNAPAAVIVSPEAYRRMSEAEENLALMELALQRLEANAGKQPVPAAEVYKRLGIDAASVETLDEVEFE